MILVIQRVSQAQVDVDGDTIGKINEGLMVLLGIEDADGASDTEWLANKLVNMRIFNDSEGVMNQSLLDVDGELLIVSQFTLHASTKKGNRPSYIKAAKPDVAIPLYNQFIEVAAHKLGKPIATGEFGADMKVSLTNDGPVTIIVDSKNKQ